MVRHETLSGRLMYYIYAPFRVTRGSAPSRGRPRPKVRGRVPSIPGRMVVARTVPSVRSVDPSDDAPSELSAETKPVAGLGDSFLSLGAARFFVHVWKRRASADCALRLVWQRTRLGTAQSLWPLREEGVVASLRPMQGPHGEGPARHNSMAPWVQHRAAMCRPALWAARVLGTGSACVHPIRLQRVVARRR